MCLVTRQRKAKILKEDIKVYKMIEDGNKSVFERFTWTKGKLFTTKLGIEYGHGKDFCFADDVCNQMYSGLNNCTGISSGFHACLTKERAKQFDIKWMNNIAVCEFLIPKGSEVFYDETDLIVSNQIMML
jgi:hypothetical protein